MHSGFRELRINMPMSLFREGAGFQPSAAVRADIARIDAIWRVTRAQFGAGGPNLFGESPGIADAMYAPVVFRFMTYQPPLSAEAEAYCAAMLAHPLMQDWKRVAAKEPEAWFIPAMEAAVTA
jgi:glutathione S-transferase